MTTVSHVPAHAITFGGTHVRQRCAWCGYVLIDADLTRIAVWGESADKPFPVWPVDGLARVTTGGGFTGTEAIELEEDEPVPDDCCMRVPPELTLAVAGMVQ
jgi:hypothetical protein